MGDFTELLLSAGYERDDQSLGAIAAAERPSTGEVETFCDEIAERLDVDPEAMIIEFAPVASDAEERVQIVVWWDGDLTRAERFGLAAAFRDRFRLESGGPQPSS